MIEQSNISELEEQSHSAPLGPTSLPVGDLASKFETQPRHPKTWSPVQSVGSIVGTEAHPECDESVWSESSRDSCIFTEDEELGMFNVTVKAFMISISLFVRVSNQIRT